MTDKVSELSQALVAELSALSDKELVDALNEVKIALHEISPFKAEPCDCVLWVPQDKLYANGYNPNVVAAPEMRLLHESIKLDGYTMPIVTYCRGEDYEIVDGFHRSRVGKEYSDINRRVGGFLPITTIDKPADERMGSTIRHNRARGTHGIRPMSDIVLELARSDWEDSKICEYLGMELDEVIRLKQITGLKDAFKDHVFSKSWEEMKRGD